MKKKKKLFGGVWLFAAALLVAFSLPAFGAATITMGAIKDNANNSISLTSLMDISGSLIDAYYYNPSGSDPRLTTNRLSLASDLNAYNTNPIPANDDGSSFSVYRGYVSSSNSYYFVRNASDSAPGGTVYIRVWKSNPNQQGSYYSAVHGFANGAFADVPATLNATTSYKADAPYTPLITKFEETVTTMADGSKSSSLKVYSSQPSATDGVREVTGYSWEMGTSADGLSAVSGATAATLSLDSAALTVGQTYYFSAIHSNWFGSKASVVASYTVRGSGEVDVQSVTLNLVKGTNGINSIAMPFGAESYVGSTKISTALDLVNAINTAAGAKVVTSFGRYKAGSMAEGVILKADSTDAQSAFGEGITGLANISLEKGVGYQVYVNKNVSLTIKNTAE